MNELDRGGEVVVFVGPKEMNVGESEAAQQDDRDEDPDQARGAG